MKRRSRESEPWYGWAISSPASVLTRAAIFSDCARLLTKTSVVRASRMRSSTSGPTEVQIVPSTWARSSTGERISVSIFFTSPQSTISTGRKVSECLDRPPARRSRRGSARSPRAGVCVAESPMRCGASGARRARRSRVSARCAPRLVPATAWISSTITARSALNIVRPRTLVRRMCSDSGVVMRTCGVLRSMRARAAAGVSPVRTATRISGNFSPAFSKRSFSCASGSSRLRWTSLLSALSGET